MGNSRESGHYSFSLGAASPNFQGTFRGLGQMSLGGTFFATFDTFGKRTYMGNSREGNRYSNSVLGAASPALWLLIYK